MPKRLAKKVLLIGWDAADWQFINPLLDAGMMPTLEGMINRGVIGNIATLAPVLSPMLWTSIATGKRAHKHGIYGFIEPRPDGQGVQPVSSTSRKCKAIWNILSQNNLKCNVVGWYASHPAEPINGCCVSNMYGRLRGTRQQSTAIPDDAFHPRRIRNELMELAVHPEEMQPEHILPFVPKLREIPDEKMTFVNKARALLADCATIQAAATHLMLTEPWDFMGVYFEAIDVFGHEFMGFHPPRMDHIDPQMFEWFKDVMTGVYRFHDMMLDALLKCADEDTTVILLSDHGFHSGEQRPPDEPGITDAAPAWHRSYGVLAMQGPGILKDERVHGATLLDIAPTILSLFGLPVGRDMDGKAIVTAFEQPPTIEFIDTWETVPGEAGMHPPETRADPFEAQEALRQLADLGYVNLPTGEVAAQVDVAVSESKFNLATSLLSSNQVTEAIPLLRELYASKPNEKKYAMCLAQALVSAGNHNDARKLLEETREQFGSADYWKLTQARMLFAEGKRADALAMLERAENQAAPSAPLQVEIAGIYESTHDWPRAAAAYGRAVEIDPDYSPAHCGLGIVALNDGRYQDAVEHMLSATALTYFYPRAHFGLAVALARLGWWERAIKAFEVCVRLYPRMVAAHRYLADIHVRLGNATEAMLHQSRVRELIAQAHQAGVAINTDALDETKLPAHPSPEPASEVST